MPQTRRRYTWTLTWDDPLMHSEVVGPIRDTGLRWVLLKPKRYLDIEFAGEALGLLRVTLTTIGRDEMATLKYARHFAKALAVVSRIPVRLLNSPDPDKLPPHDHRGSRAILAPKYQEF